VLTIVEKPQAATAEPRSGSLIVVSSTSVQLNSQQFTR
jgi:hypothetical protein